MNQLKTLIAIVAILLTTNLVNAQQFINLKKAVQPVFKSKNAIPKNSSKPVFTNHFFKLEDMISKPGSSEDYIWDEESEVWIHYSNTLYSYSETGILLVELASEAETGEYLSRYTHEYNENGDLTEEVSYFWNGLEWIISNGFKFSYSYDENGKLTDEIGQIWENNSWKNDWKNTYFYNENNVPELMLGYNWNGSDWENFSKYIDIEWYSWANEQIEAYTLQFKIEGGTWINEERFSAIYDGSNSVETYEKWNGSAWANSERNTYVKTTDTEVWTMEHSVFGQWVNFEQYTNTFDEYGSADGYKYESWEVNAWELQFEYIFSHTYNENADITETVVQFWEPTFPSAMNVSYYIYSDFLYFTTEVPDIIELKNVRIYPNPVKSSINLKFEDVEFQSYFVDVISVSGQTMLSKEYPGSSASINLGKLSPGMYILRIRTNNGKIYSEKFLKE